MLATDTSLVEVGPNRTVVGVHDLHVHFAAGLTNVEVDMEIVDTDNGATWTYVNQ